MSVNTDRIRYLFNRYLQKTCTEEELLELFAFIAQPENRPLVEELMDEEYEVLAPAAEARETDWEHMFGQAVQPKEDNQVYVNNVKRLQWVRVAAAAIVVIAVGVAAYWFISRPGRHRVAQNDQPVKPAAADVLPGSNKAVLTLADGSVITLDSAKAGVLTEQGNVRVFKNKDGEVIYKSGEGKARAITYNLLSTPRGGQYQLVLPDGTKVWLNAASSIRYPVTFTGNERRVELTGEAYFEVKTLRLRSGQKMPFHVITATQDVEVLGTHFNVNAYANEPAVKTTLLEGKVKVNQLPIDNKQLANKKQGVILKPGEQAMGNCQLPIANCRLVVDHSPDLEQIMAWKNGFTVFNKADIKSIMRQVERWYNVDVVYVGEIPKRTFTGGIERSARLSELLRLLEVSKVKFRIEDKKLIVTP
jgi:transmembrane sensor